jgi:hypothetical protein
VVADVAPQPVSQGAAMISAIPTSHNGVKFRSRLEARWAYFFDILSVPYRYEYEGFQLGDRWYVPDFWLPETKTWIEIKPPFNREYEREELRYQETVTLCGQLAGKTKNKVVLLACGFGDWLLDDWKHRRNMIAFFGRSDGDDYGTDNPYLPAVCSTCGKLGFEFEGRSERICGGRCHWNGTVITRPLSDAVQAVISHSFWNPSR